MLEIFPKALLEKFRYIGGQLVSNFKYHLLSKPQQMAAPKKVTILKCWEYS